MAGGPCRKSVPTVTKKWLVHGRILARQRLTWKYHPVALAVLFADTNATNVDAVEILDYRRNDPFGASSTGKWISSVRLSNVDPAR